MINTENYTTVYLDGEGQILGRLASIVAKSLLNGNKVIVVNADKLVLKGSWLSIEKEWQARLALKSAINPFRYSPKRYIRPDMYFKRVVRGMLPWRKPKGKQALRRLRVYIGIPKHLENVKFINYEDIYSGVSKRYVTLGQIAARFGWKEVGPING
ncbi:MAG: 50S ribosomal protein L13 [Thermoprotei archaeon]